MKNLDRFAPIVLGAIILLLHGLALGRPLFSDDYLFLDRVRDRGLADALAQPDAIGNFWRPLTRQAYFWLAAHVFAESAPVMHVVNLLALVAIVSLLFALVRRWAGARAAWTAALLVAVSAAWDVPVLWGSGTQDLFAILFALGALHCADRGRNLAGALLYGLGLLSKEVIVLLPLLIALVARMRRPSVRAAALPYAAVFLAWLVPWSLRMRASAGAPRMPNAPDALAAFAHLPQVVLGIEAGPLAPLDLRLLASALVVAVLAVSVLRASSAREKPRVDLGLLGLAWMAIGILPVVLVAPIWSDYFYAFALCGAGSIAGAWARARSWRTSAALLLVVLAGATLSRQRAWMPVPEGAWTGRSHIDASYVLRSERLGRTMLASLKRAVPRPAPRTTFFFSGVPEAISWQVLDGPYVRWAYRDSSLRSYFLSQMSEEHVARGPVYLFRFQADTLFEIGNQRGLTFGTAARALLQGDRAVARGALRFHLARWPDDAYARTLRAWIANAEGDVHLRDVLLGTTGLERDTALARAALADARERMAAGDTTGGRQAVKRALAYDPLDPRAHAAAADLAALGPGNHARILVESYAVLALAPDDPFSWRRWAFVQAYFGEMDGSLDSVARYRALAPEIARDDAGVEMLVTELRRRAGSAPAGGQLTFD